MFLPFVSPGMPPAPDIAAPPALIEQVFDLLFVLPPIAGVADADGKSLAAFDGHGDGLSAQGDFDDVLNIAHVDAVSGGFLAVDVDLQIAFADVLVGSDIDRAGNFSQHGRHLFRHFLNFVQIVAENLYADHRAHAGGEHVDAVDDRLGPDISPAGHLHGAVHFLDDVGLFFAP